MFNMFREQCRNFLSFVNTNVAKMTPVQRIRLKNNCTQAFILLTSFYILMGMPVLGPILQTALSTNLVGINTSFLGLASAYTRHLALFASQAAFTLFFMPEKAHHLGASFFNQVFGFIAALVAGTFARQVAFLVQPFIKLLSFFVGSTSLAYALTTVAVLALAAAPVFLALQHNARRPSTPSGDDIGRFSLSQIVMMAYSSFIGACFPQFAFIEPRIPSWLNHLIRLTGGQPQGVGQQAVDAAYTHFSGLSVPLGSAVEMIFSSKKPSTETPAPVEQQPARLEERAPVLLR